MSNQKVSLSEKMSRLKGSFIEQLPERISELKHCCKRIRVRGNHQPDSTVLHVTGTA